jgi:ribose transport system ATP-binding protein
MSNGSSNRCNNRRPCSEVKPAQPGNGQPGRDVRSHLALNHISKAFPGVQALKDVSFDVRGGEVHALIGENGAGKSTLLKILSGAHQADSGAISINGRETVIDNPRAARQLGIAIIYQELTLIPWLSVAHNLYLGRETKFGRGILPLKRMNASARDELEKIGIHVDPAVPVAELGVAEQQMVEIARALSENAQFLLMDEPTASLTEREIEILFEKIVALRDSGVALVYISHRLEEIPRIANRVTVLRDGAVVHTGPVSEVPLGELISKMVGRPISSHFPVRTPARGAEVLKVEPSPGTTRSRAVTVHKGEVVGLAGLVGSGRTEWAWRLMGAAPGSGERIFMSGTPAHIRSPSVARELGIGMVPENRKDHGLVLGRSIRDNISLTILNRLANWCGLINQSAQAKSCGLYVDRLAIRCSTDAVECSTLSGGNQQKIVLAKWLVRDCQIIILDEPTRGIDVGTKFEMYKLINELSRAGKAVILISSDLPELISMSDRIYVMHLGDFVAELDSRQTSQEEVIHFAFGYFNRT